PVRSWWHSRSGLQLPVSHTHSLDAVGGSYTPRVDFVGDGNGHKLTIPRQRLGGRCDSRALAPSASAEPERHDLDGQHRFDQIRERLVLHFAVVDVDEHVCDGNAEVLSRIAALVKESGNARHGLLPAPARLPRSAALLDPSVGFEARERRTSSIAQWQNARLV